MLSKRQRMMVDRARKVCDEIGGLLDVTATPAAKLARRQKAHSLVSKVLYGVLVDDPDNEQRDYDVESAMEALVELEKVK